MDFIYIVLLIVAILIFNVFKYMQSDKKSWLIAAICEIIATILLSLLISFCQSLDVSNNHRIDNELITSNLIVENTSTLTTNENLDNTMTEITASTENTTNIVATTEQIIESITTAAQTTQTEPYIPQEPQPVPIKSLIMKKASTHYNISQTEFDPRGKMYNNVICLYSSATNGIGSNGRLELYTERKFSTFNCTFIPQADYSTNSGAGAYIEIYKDDVLSYTSDLITYRTTAIDVNLDIRNTEYLKIKIINVNKNHPYMAYADTLICDAYVME